MSQSILHDPPDTEAVTAHPKCKICGSPSEFICVTPNEHGPIPAIYHHRCASCGLVFVANKISSGDLNLAYGTIDSDCYYREIALENSKKLKTASAALDRFLNGDRRSKVIDIGCGDGGFLNELLSRGYRSLAGHEIPGPSLCDLESRGVKLYRGDDWAGIPTGEFDCVTLLDVTEHVMDPTHLFRECFRILRPGGVVYLHTPVVTVTDRMMHWFARTPGLAKVGRVWQRGRTSIFHLQNYTEKALRLLLREAGFSGVDVDRKNELSWPVSRYIRVYLCEKNNLPLGLAPLLAPFAYPFLATSLFNGNKAIVTARKP